MGGLFTDDVRRCILALAKNEVATAKMSPVIQCVGKYIFHHEFQNFDLPHGNTCQNIVDEGHYIATQYIADKLEQTAKWGLHKDGTTRKRRKLLDTSVCLESGEQFSIGFSEVASETGKAITEDSIAKLSEIMRSPSNMSATLKKLTYTMTDRAANEKKSNRLLAEHCQSIMAKPPNIRFLLFSPCPSRVTF
ncbi:hypothetical protein RRG08_001704 [Elysia crispata]|uniref:Uncharacterized protein n=1 Tax=Elysia crispata TaxID=231223 RepID=A0AAE1E021_9GAST|nr:hypothetical protein RRG08_001704 [Elysia crispata]